jgi:ABC-type lipoprotein export system ATPase subunit
VIRIEDLTFRYPTGEFRLEIPALEIERGSTASVIGPSGCGKTTLLHLLAGIVTPLGGRIRVGETEVSALPDAARREFRIAGVGLVFQEFELLDYLSVLDNILLPYRITSALRIDGPVRDRARALADEVGIGDKLRRSPRRLSHGERQRVAVCRALVTEPRLLLADEPTGNLDPENTSRVLDILLEFAKRSGATLLTVTHDHGHLDRFERVVDASEWAGS